MPIFGCHGTDLAGGDDEAHQWRHHDVSDVESAQTVVRHGGGEP